MFIDKKCSFLNVKFKNLIGDVERYIGGKIYRFKIEVKKKMITFFLTNILLLNDFVYLSE